MAITPISGLIDPAALEANADAEGPKVAAELQQLINKSGEVVAETNTQETGIAANVVSIAGNASDIAANVSAISANGILIAGNASDIADNASDIAAIDQLSKVFLTASADTAYVVDVFFIYSFLQLTGTGAGASSALLPDPATLTLGRVITIYSTRVGDILVYLDDDGTENMSIGDTIECTVTRDNLDTENIWALTNHFVA